MEADGGAVAFLIEYIWIPLYAGLGLVFQLLYKLSSRQRETDSEHDRRIALIEQRDEQREVQRSEQRTEMLDAIRQQSKTLDTHNTAVLTAVTGLDTRVQGLTDRIGVVERTLMRPQTDGP